MHHTPHFATQSQQPSKALCQWEQHLSPSCTCVNFVLAAILQQPHHYSQTFSQRWHLWGLERSGNLRQQDLGCMVGGKEQSISVLWLLTVCSHWCGRALSCGRRISSTFYEVNSPETLLQGFKGLNVHIRVNGLTMWHIAYQNHPICIPQMWPWLTAEGVALNCIFQAEVGWCHSNDSLFVSSPKRWNHVSSPVMIRYKGLSQSAL